MSAGGMGSGCKLPIRRSSKVVAKMEAGGLKWSVPFICGTPVAVQSVDFNMEI
jgi:hypothetical protein